MKCVPNHVVKHSLQVAALQVWEGFRVLVPYQTELQCCECCSQPSLANKAAWQVLEHSSLLHLSAEEGTRVKKYQSNIKWWLYKRISLKTSSRIWEMSVKYQADIEWQSSSEKTKHSSVEEKFMIQNAEHLPFSWCDNNSHLIQLREANCQIYQHRPDKDSATF